MKSSPTEQRNPRSIGIDEKSVEEVLKIINSEDRLVPAVVASEIPRIADAVEAVASVIGGGGRVFFIGAGTSGRLGVIEAVEMPTTFGVSNERFQGIIAGGPDAMIQSVEGAEDDETSGGMALDEQGREGGDILVAISASGRTPFTVGALRRARERGSRTVAITCNLDSPVAELAEIAITPKVGAELVAGSTRMKAGTAQKLVLNMLTTATMIKLGKVYDGYMIGVQPRSQKLRMRAKYIVSSLAEVSAEEAGEALEHADSDVKVAILLAKTRTTPEEAKRVLQQAEGSLRKALDILRCLQ